MTRVCPGCNREFEPTPRSRQFCRPSCQARYQRTGQAALPLLDGPASELRPPKPIANKTTHEALSGSSWPEHLSDPRWVNFRGRRDRASSRRAEGGSDRYFASPKALICGDPRVVVGPRRSAPAGLYAKQPRQSVSRQHSMPRVRHAGVDLHTAAGGRRDLELSSTRIEESQCAKRSPTSGVLPLRPSGFLIPSWEFLFHRVRMSWMSVRRPTPPVRHSALPTLQLSQPSAGSRSMV